MERGRKEIGVGAETLTRPAQAVSRSRHAPRMIPMWLMSFVAGALWVAGASFSSQDVNDYHCYALAFWSGARATASLEPGSCLTPISLFSNLPFHTVPLEYGPLALITFLPPLIVPATWYNTAFFVEMALVGMSIAWLLDRYGPLWSGHVWLIYGLIGSWILVAGRFDAAPAACVVVALLAAQRGRLTWAYVALALGVLMKLYPLALLPLLLLVSWRERGREPLWRGPAAFVAIVGVVEGWVALIAPASLLTPFTYMSARCVQIESAAATFASLWARVTQVEPDFPYAYNSTCEATAAMGASQMIALGLGVVGIALALALFWRGRISLGLAALLTLGALLVGSKVLSPQYLIWISPLIALEFGANVFALVGWSLVGALTTACFPYAYNGSLSEAFDQGPYPLIVWTAGARNLLALALGVTVFARQLRPLVPQQHAGEAS